MTPIKPNAQALPKCDWVNTVMIAAPPSVSGTSLTRADSTHRYSPPAIASIDIAPSLKRPSAAGNIRPCRLSIAAHANAPTADANNRSDMAEITICVATSGSAITSP
jgi:hypothetical protein